MKRAAGSDQEGSLWTPTSTDPRQQMAKRAQWILPQIPHSPLSVTPAGITAGAQSSLLYPHSTSHILGAQQMFAEYLCMCMWCCFTKPLSTHHLISGSLNKPLLSTYYVLGQDQHQGVKVHPVS